MMLFVDMGNSCLKWATYNYNNLSLPVSLFYQENNFTAKLISSWSEYDITSVWVANVAGAEKAKILRNCIKSCWNLKPIFLQTQINYAKVINGYNKPKQLGIDRWLNLIAAYNLQENTNFCIIDCGTATTVDILLANGYHQGGLIIPGLVTMQNSLSKQAYQLANFDMINLPKDKTSFLGRDTQTGIALGIAYTTIGLIEYLVNNLDQQNINFILTGGLASKLTNLLRRPYRLIPELVLRGIQVIAVDNQ
ncbi:MAG: type III pantothenate kinase [Thiomargarita sp.]|nr:type III pantothenate kinase [Thiomargarita sp.]